MVHARDPHGAADSTLRVSSVYITLLGNALTAAATKAEQNASPHLCVVPLAAPRVCRKRAPGAHDQVRAYVCRRRQAFAPREVFLVEPPVRPAVVLVTRYSRPRLIVRPLLFCTLRGST